MANYQGELYNLPFNMNTFNQMWGVVTPQQAQNIIERQRAEIDGQPKNLEEQAISLVGQELYQKLVKGYTQKQWGRSCKELPAFIIKRLPVRFTFNNNYYNDLWQGIPIEGYNAIFEQLLAGCDIRLNIDFNKNRNDFAGLARKIVYTGPVDAYFNFSLGRLEYRTLRFEHIRLNIDNYQGVAAMNFTDAQTPYTRIIEHKHFVFGNQPITYITKEYPEEFSAGSEPYYPINDEKNQLLYQNYRIQAMQEKNVLFCGRLAEYRYYDMDAAIDSALKLVRSEFNC